MNNPRFSFLAFTVFFLRNDCTRECPPGNARRGMPGWGFARKLGSLLLKILFNFFLVFFQMYCDSRRKKSASRNEASKYIIQYG